ncbi:MAG: hypothetical protein M0Z75_15590 [Nitrospiraceae bacterium]|nr:hypothetical protein [Nitrospiraceae bacterium]
MDSQVELLKICIGIENAISETYGYLADRFPEERAFWKALAEEEKTHARKFVVSSSLKGAAGLPSSLQLAQDALAAVKKARREIFENAGLRLEDAFEIAISLEMTAVEDFFARMQSGEADDEMKGFFGAFLLEGRQHAERLRRRLAGIRSAGRQSDRKRPRPT